MREIRLNQLNRTVTHLIETYKRISNPELEISDGWTAKDILGHLTFWHESFARNVGDLDKGREPVPLKGKYVDLNLRSLQETKDLTVEQIIERLSAAHEVIQRSILSPTLTRIPYRKGSRDYTPEEHLDIVNGHIKEHLKDLAKAQKQTSVRDNWARGNAYEPYVGRWSRLVAREFLAWLAIAPGSRWLDVGCGTGALTQTILQDTQPAAVKGVDRSDDFLAFALEQIPDPRISFAMADAQALPEIAETYDGVVSGLVLNFIPQPIQAVKEMVRVVCTGGVVGVYVWDYASHMQFMRHFWDAAAALDPTAFDLDEGRRFPLCQAEPLAQLFHTAGLKDVEVRAIDIPTVFQDFEDYWLPFLGGQGPAPSYTMSLNEERRIALRERLRASLPFALDGSIPLVARAWAVRGIK